MITLFVKPIAHIHRFLNSFKSEFIKFSWILILVMPIALAIGAILEADRFEKSAGTPFLTKESEEKIRSGLEVPAYRTQTIFPFVTFVTKYGPTFANYEYTNEVHWHPGTTIVAIASWLMLLVLIRLNGKINGASIEVEKFDETARERYIKNTNTNIDTVRDDCINSRRIAEQMNNKALVLLAAGIILAFAGIALFYFTTPATKDIEVSTIQLIRESVRPVGMLLFIEALAWFLLKQYQAATQEYRYYLNNADRKTNLLIAFLTIEDKTQRQYIVENILQNNHNVLKAGETTESLENHKLSHSNPIIEFGNKVIEKANLK